MPAVTFITFILINSLFYKAVCTYFAFHDDSVTFPVAETISTTNASSNIECAVKCVWNPECNSLSYNEDSNVCLLSEATNLTVHSVVNSAPGFNVYTKGIFLCLLTVWCLLRGLHVFFIFVEQGCLSNNVCNIKIVCI